MIKIFSDFRQKRFEKECRNRFLQIQKTFRRNRFFIFFGFVTFSDFEQKFSKNLHKIFRKVVKTAIYVFRQRVWWKKGNLLKIVFFSKIEQFFSWLLAKNIPQRWQNCFVSVKTNTLMYNKIFENVFFFLFRFLAEKFPNFLIFFAKFWKQLLKNWDEQFDQKMFFEKNLLNFFRKWIELFSDFRQKSYGKIVRNVFYVFKNMLKEQIFSISILSCRVVGFWAKHFWHLAEYFPQSCQNCFLRVQKKTLMKKEDFWKLFFLSKFEQIFSWLLAKNILQNWQNCFLSVQTNTLMYSQHLLWKVLPLLLDFGRNFFWIFEFFFFAKVWKLFSKNWNKHFNQKTLFWKILKFFRNRIQTFSDFRPKVYGKIVRTVIYVFKNMLKEQNFSIFFLFVVYSDFEQNFSDIWHKIFHKAVKTAFYVIRRTLWWKEMILETCFFSKFEQIYSWLLKKLFFKVGRTAF